MGDTSTDPNPNTGPGVAGWPPPTTRMASFAFGAAAVIAGLLGYCLLAAILALLSLIFNLWDYFGNRGGSGGPKTYDPGSGPGGAGGPRTGTQGPTPTSSGGTGKPDTYRNP